MTEDIPIETKVTILWQERLDAKAAAEARATREAITGAARRSGLRGLIEAMDSKVLVVIAAAFVGIGQGPDVVGRIITIFEFILGVHK